ncbi:hypothetical protein RhiTH_005672 [Rhizoctonia solani]
MSAPYCTRFFFFFLALATSIDAAPSSDSRQANAYLDAHNSFRAQHAADPLTWSTKLETKAQGWANGCRFKHGSTGENLAVGTGDFGAAAAVKLWTDEIGRVEEHHGTRMCSNTVSRRHNISSR